MIKENKTDKISIGDATFNRLSRLYVIALIFIAFTALLSQIVIQYFLKNQLNDSKVVNIAGRQRMLSQKLTKEILLTAKTPNLNYKKQLQNTLEQWTAAHNGLQNGDKELGLPGNNSATTKELFRQLIPSFQALNELSIKLLEESNTVTSDSLYLQKVLTNEAQFLEVMDAIVFQYEREAKNSVEKLKTTEFLLFGLLLSILLMEVLAIFRPAAQRVRRIVQELSDAEGNARIMAAENKELFLSKERSLKELQTMNYAMDKAALYASLTQDGRLLHISEKFLYLLDLPTLTDTALFAEQITDQAARTRLLERINYHTEVGILGR